MYHLEHLLKKRSTLKAVLLLDASMNSLHNHSVNDVVVVLLE